MMAQQPPEEPIFLLTGSQLQDIISRAIQEATEPLDPAFNNRNLFPITIYQPNSKSLEWNKKEHSEAFTAIKRVYKALSAFFDGLKESPLEERIFTLSAAFAENIVTL